MKDFSLSYSISLRFAKSRKRIGNQMFNHESFCSVEMGDELFGDLNNLVAMLELLWSPSSLTYSRLIIFFRVFLKFGIVVA